MEALAVVDPSAGATHGRFVRVAGLALQGTVAEERHAEFAILEGGDSRGASVLPQDKAVAFESGVLLVVAQTHELAQTHDISSQKGYGTGTQTSAHIVAYLELFVNPVRSSLARVLRTRPPEADERDF